MPRHRAEREEREQVPTRALEALGFAKVGMPAL
jgi:hypothetical protein